MKVAVIDNIDSFVYNLVQYVGELGAEPVVFPNSSGLDEVEDVNPDGVVISPGPKTPNEAGISTDIVRELGPEVPILGVCLGHQVIAHAFGGQIGPARQLMHGKTSRISHDGKFPFEGMPDPFEATRYHSLVVESSSLPECLEVTASTDDEFREIMGIRHKEYPLVGVQFHPESILTTQGMEIVKNFLGKVKS